MHPEASDALKAASADYLLSGTAESLIRYDAALMAFFDTHMPCTRRRGAAVKPVSTAAPAEPAFIAGPGEIAPAARPSPSRREAARLQGYTGDSCGECGNFTMVRNGTCLKCNSCGSTSGCS